MPVLSRGWHLRLPKPRTFLGVMSLQTGTEMVALSMLINKVTGIYGLLVIFTGYALSATQLSMYLYNVLALVALALCIPHIRRQTPLHNLGLAWLYLVDTAVNTAYITVFAVTWFLTEATAQDGSGSGSGSGSSGAEGAHTPEDGEWMGAHETAASMVFISVFTVVRMYFSAVVVAHARQVLMHYAEVQEARRPASSSAVALDEGGIKGEWTGSPFAEGMPGGEGWKGKLGRVMLSVGRDYWLGHGAGGGSGSGRGGLGDDDGWTRDVSSKFTREPVMGSSSRAVV